MTRKGPDVTTEICTCCLGSGLLRDGYDDYCPVHADRLRWVACEACGGSGEIVRLAPGAQCQSDTYSELCAECEGTGRDCVETQPVECDDELSG